MADADPSPDAKPAPRLGSYLLVQALGSGGMSNVFRAVHEESGSVVAVKVLPRTLAKNPTLLQRFMREAKSAESLDHPNIVAIYDRGFDQGRHYLVLEYVEGRDLHDRVRLNGPLGADEAVAFVREVAEGLRYAAGRGMIHRDVKPANLLMTPDGHAKIIDLGLALQIEDEDERVTRDGTTVGTVDYMAPEQARDSRQTSERSDIYSLGCTFYYLLTGAPPYAGGGLSDKLARHYKAPIPDVREHRPDVSEPLSLLIRRMMEKKPERRQADYTQLIEALDTLGEHPTHDVTGGTLDALIVDDEDDEIGLAPTESALARNGEDGPPSSREAPLMAEILDDDEDDDPGPTLPPPGPRPRGVEAAPAAKPRPPAPEAPAELSLAELAALDVDDAPAPRRSGARNPASSSASSLRAPSNPAQSASRSPSKAFAPVPNDDDEEEVYGSDGPVRKGSGSELPLKTWIWAGALVGLGIVVLGVGASMLVSLTRPEKAPDPRERVAEADPAEPEPTRPTYPTYGPARKTGPTIVKKDAATKKVEAPTPSPVVAAPEALVEAAYPADWESRLAPPPSPRPQVPADPKARTVVRRVNQPGDDPQSSSLAAAFSRANDLVEIADVGPFFEDDCLIAGKTRLIRAREGLRPMIKVEATDSDIIKEQAAKFVLGDKRVDHLVLEGLDIAVNVRDLPGHQTTLFLCKGVDLTLRDCSLTVINANDPARTQPFSIFRVEEGARPNRIVLERTIIRGPVGTLVDLAAARAEVVFSRSLVLGDSGPLIRAEAADKAARSFWFYRSVLVARGHVLDLPGRPGAPIVRSLGTIFARVDAGNGTTPGLISLRAPGAGEPSSVVDWAGEDDEFIGWPAWLTTGPEASVRVANLDGVRSSWPGSDATSRESTAPWPPATRPDEVPPVEFAGLAPHRKPTLAKIAASHPRFRDLTLGSLAPLATPKLSADLIPRDALPAPKVAAPGPASPPPAPPKAAVAPPSQPNATGPRPKNAGPKKAGPAMQGAASPAAPGPLNLTFDLKDPAWKGDLGRYLAEKLVPGTPRATVTVRGSGTFEMSPIRLLDNISVAILGESVEGASQPLPTFVPRPDSAGRVMIEQRGGDLAIANLAFSNEAANRPKHWVRSEDGLLALRRCRFRDAPLPNPLAAASALPGPPLIAFVARGTAPIPPRAGPLVKETDRPTARLKNCLIWAAGDALSAEVGRGVLDLDNCLVISGGTAIALQPVDVARDRFEADLVLDRCTIAAERTGVLLGRLSGEAEGPTRPWLVSSRRCAFPRTQLPGGAGTLLLVQPDAMARGVLFWQSSADAYDSLHLIAAAGAPASTLTSSDVKKQWIDVWGAEHTRLDVGPTARKNETVLRYKDREKPRPGKVVPAALEVDRGLTDYGVEFKDLPGSAGRPAGNGPAGKGGVLPPFDPRMERMERP